MDSSSGFETPGAVVARIHADAAMLVQSPVPESGMAAMSEAEDLFAAIDQLKLAAGMRIRRVDATGSAKDAGHGSTSAWLRTGGRMSAYDAGVARRDASQLDRLPHVRDALAAGRITHKMASVICAAIKPLKRAEQVAWAETILLGLADRTGDLGVVARAGAYVHQALNPDGRLGEQERAYARRHLTVRDEEDGGVAGWFYLPPEDAARLRALLDAHARPAGANGEDERTQPNATQTSSSTCSSKPSRPK